MRLGWFGFTLFLASATVVATGTACGGAQTAPSQLRYTLDDMHLAAVPSREKQDVIRSKDEYEAAQMERAKTESDYQALLARIEDTENEIDQADIVERSAQSEKEAADLSPELTRKNAADRELRVARLGRHAAEAKMAYLEAERDWLRKLLRYDQHHIYATQARYEFDKGRVAQTKNIRPPGFELGNFERQYKERDQAAQQAHAAADKARKDADQRKAAWEAKVHDLEAARDSRPGVPVPASVEPANAGSSAPSPAAR